MKKIASLVRAEGEGPSEAAVGSPWFTSVARQQQREAKRYAVLQVAAQLFNERGFHATSLDDIAAQLHVSKPTLYYYVKNKEQILIECMQEALRLMFDDIEAARQKGLSTLDELRACMQVYGTMATEPFGACLIRVGDEVLSAEVRQELRRMKSEVNLRFRSLVEQGVREGVLAPCDATVTAFMIQGALSWFARWYQPGGKYAQQEVVQQTMEGLLQGLLQRGEAPSSAPAKRQKAVKKPSED